MNTNVSTLTSCIIASVDSFMKVCLPAENSKGLAVKSSEFLPDEYDLVGDILSVCRDIDV